MSLPQSAPGGWGEGYQEHFAYASTAKGSAWHAYIAGPPMWFMCHQPLRTKPCLAVMTGRALDCPWCGTDKDVVRRAYLPVYRQTDNAPRCVIVNELYEEALRKLPLHARITVGKGEEKGDPVWIMKAITPTPHFQTTLAHRTRPVDLTRTLLKLWGYQPLRDWYAATFGKPGAPPSDTAVSLPPGVAVHADGRPVAPMLQAAAKRAGFDVVPGSETDADVERARQHLAAVQAGAVPGRNGNGRHKPPPKG